MIDVGGGDNDGVDEIEGAWSSATPVTRSVACMVAS